MLFSGIGAGKDVETAGLVDLLQGRCKTKETTRANAAAATRAALIDAQRFVPAPSVSIFLRLLCLTFSGNCGLPKSPVYKFATCTGVPCLTVHSPRSCKYGRHCRDCARSSAACFDTRMCPASPQSITLCAVLIPAPATFIRSLTSRTSLTGPL